VTAAVSVKPGDIVCGCRHQPSPYDAHWYGFPEPVGVLVARAGATEVIQASWVILCDACEKKRVMSGDSALSLAAGHFVWKKGMREPALGGSS